MNRYLFMFPSMIPSLAGISLVAALVAGQGIAADVQPEERTISSQPSWILANDSVEVAVTKLGGHMAPVTFDRTAAA